MVTGDSQGAKPMRKEKGQMKKVCVQAGRQTKKAVTTKLRKRYSVPLWALLVLIGIPLFCEKFPDPGSYYHRQNRQQLVTESIVQASGLASSDPAPIVGIDVSKWQGSIDWKAVKESGVEFAIIKATEGITYIDPAFIANWDEAKTAGLLVSAYHMLWPQLSAAKQAEHLLNTMGEREADFPLVLDVELKGTGDNIGAVVEEVLLALEAKDGRKPIIYTAQSFWGANVGWAPGWHKYPLWVADYDVAVPAMPLGWEVYDFWQYSNRGSVPGISGNVDLNVFAGELQDLSSLGRKEE